MIEGFFGFGIFNSRLFFFLGGGGVGKFGKYFLGGLNLSTDFSGYSKQSKDSW